MKKSGQANVRSETKRVKAIAAFSGGLDSLLAAEVTRRAGADVTLLHVRHLFSADETGLERLRAAAERLSFPLRGEDVSEDHLETIRRPKHGYGQGMNPCVDCRIFMLKVAKRVMEEEDAQFVVTGEVLGQRPKSQHYQALMQAAEESGLGDRLVRPLSANLLPDTLPVTEGWIGRESLLSIQGRSRELQMALAKELGIIDYPQPAGGCLLIEKAYATRLRDAFEHHGVDAIDLEAFRLLRHGRHFRISEGVKVIVGRNKWENAMLDGFARGRIHVEPIGVMGPTTLVEGEPTDEELQLALSIAARYCDAEGASAVSFNVRVEESSRRIEAPPLDPDDLRIVAWRIGD